MTSKWTAPDSRRHARQTAGKSNRGRRLAIATAIALPVLMGVYLFLASGPDEVAQLVEELRTGDNTQRYKAAKDLEDLGPNATAAVQQLAVALKDSELKVRYRSAKALSRMGPPAAAATPALAESLQDPERDVRYYAAKSLYKIGEDAQPALDAILRIVEAGESDADVRRYLVKCLGEIGEDEEHAHEVVASLARDRDARIREEVAEILEDFQD